MSVTAVIGAQWGDEGKGRIVDYLAKAMDMVIRFNGGGNAGHTVINEIGEFKLHLVPVGIFNPETICIIGNGVAIDAETLTKEIEALKEKGVYCKNLRISKKAHLVMPWHILIDELQEKERGKGEIGTTRRGIGPVFSDKVARFGLRVEDLLDKERFAEKLLGAWRRRKDLIFGNYSDRYYHLRFPELIFNQFLISREKLLPYITDIEPIIWKALDKDKKILLEGAQGTLLDIDFGTYRQVTSSLCTAAGACQGSGIPPNRLTEVIGVVKAYTTRVCEKVHRFDTEMPERVGDILRETAGEYGATTGRPRRIGWLDIPKLRYAARINGFTSLAVTRLDSLGALSFVKICQRFKKNGEPIYQEMPGWTSDISHCRDLQELPVNAQEYLRKIERMMRVPKKIPIRFISVGPERNQIIVKE